MLHLVRYEKMTTASPISLRSWIALFALGILLVLRNIDYIAINLNLAPIPEELKADLDLLQLFFSAFFLVCGRICTLYRRFQDLYLELFNLYQGLFKK